MSRDLQHRVGLLLAAVLAVAMISLGVWIYAYGQALDGLSRQARADLALSSDRLQLELKRYGELAVLTTDRQEVLAAVKGQDLDAARQHLVEVADKMTALEVALVDAQRRVRVAARGTHPAELPSAPFVDRAMQGALGWGNALWPNGRRVFHYAAPVFGNSGQVEAALIVAMDLGFIELDWVGTNPAMYFTDPQGTVFVTNRSELTFWARLPGAPGLVPPEGEARPFSARFRGQHEIWRLNWSTYLPNEALHIEQPLHVVGLTGEALVDVAPAKRLATLQASAVGALCLAFCALLFMATERRRTLAEANAQLEARVTARTQELSAANVSLRREVAERTRAQEALAQAQADLVQAGKLSALGQMSAGISHELNQPLMAIQNFSENGKAFLERGQAGRAGENLGRISDMAGRMSRIIRNLRAFARQESMPAEKVDVIAVLDNAIELTEAAIKAAGVRLEYDRIEGPLWVRGGQVRLAQVFVNLITNAAEAMETSPVKVLRIVISDGKSLTVNFHDTGPGIDMPDKVFEPFYSTKVSGEQTGMGLGLSISYGIVQSFGGEIRGSNASTGAIFTVQLERWEQVQEAAE